MIDKIIFGLIIIIFTIVAFEIAFNEINDMSKDSNQNFTNSYRGHLKSIYKFRWGVYVFTIIVVITTLFVPIVNVEPTEEELKENPEAKPHKQTYLEYVKERLEVERSMRR